MKEKKEEKTGWLGGLGIGAVSLMGLVRLGDWCNDYYTQREQAEIRRNQEPIPYKGSVINPNETSNRPTAGGPVSKYDKEIQDINNKWGFNGPIEDYLKPRTIPEHEIPAKQETATTTTTPTAELETPTITQIQVVPEYWWVLYDYKATKLPVWGLTDQQKDRLNPE